MHREEFQHFQPNNQDDAQTRAEEILKRITEHPMDPLSDEDKATLALAGYGTDVEQIEQYQKDTTLPPWMH